MRESREFYISDDGIRLHLKLDFPQENCDENSDESCGKSGGESFGEGCSTRQESAIPSNH